MQKSLLQVPILTCTTCSQCCALGVHLLQDMLHVGKYRHTKFHRAGNNAAVALQRIEALPLPPNFLDTLIEKLGGPRAVAEMTGRKGRVVRDSKGHGVYELRAKPDSSEMDSLNVKEAGRLAFLCMPPLACKM